MAATAKIDERSERETPAPQRTPKVSRPFSSLEAVLSGRRWRRTARWIGILIFFLGAALLGFVFVQALSGFGNIASPDYLQSQVDKVAGTGSKNVATAWVSVLGGELLRLIYLLLLGYLGSIISTKGIQFFAASESVIDEAVLGVNEE